MKILFLLRIFYFKTIIYAQRNRFKETLDMYLLIIKNLTLRIFVYSFLSRRHTLVFLVYKSTSSASYCALVNLFNYR